MQPSANEPLVVSTRIGRRGQMVLPAEVRRALGIGEGDTLLIVAWPDGRMIVRPRPKSYTDALAGAGATVWRGVDPVQLQREERDAWNG